MFWAKRRGGPEGRQFRQRESGRSPSKTDPHPGQIQSMGELQQGCCLPNASPVLFQKYTSRGGFGSLSV